MLMGAPDWILNHVDGDTKRAFGLCEAAYAAHKLHENDSESLLSFERNMDICLQKGYRFIRIVGGTFRWIPADAQMPPDETTTPAPRIDPDAEVLTPMYDYEGDVVEARHLTILIDLAERKDGCCRALENGTQNKSRNMYNLCPRTNVDSNGLCSDHRKRETSHQGRLAWTVRKHHEYRYVLVHPIYGFAFSILVTKSQAIGFCEDMQLGDYRNLVRSPHYTADTRVHGGAQNVQRMHAVIASVENSDQFVEGLLAVADTTMDWLEGWPGRTVVTDDSYEGAYSASHKEALAAAAALRKEATELKSQLEASGGRPLFVPGSENKPDCLTSCRTASRVFEFGAPVGSETEIAGWNDKPKKALDALMAMIERLDAARLHLWAELSSVGFNSWEHIEDPKNVQTRSTLVSKLPGLVSAYGSLTFRLSKMYRTVSTLLGMYRDTPQNGDEPVDGMRRPLISHSGSLLKWL
jgi:hypothetical protein